MKSTLLSFFLSVFILYGYGQTTQKGMVTLFNSGNTPLPGTGILAIGAPATDTDLGGNFTLTLPKASQGQALIISEIHKKGYELVNDAIMYSWILSEKRPMKIIMAPEGTINESKERIYNVSLQHETARFQKNIEELDALYQQNKLTEEERRQSIAALSRDVTQRRSMLQQYADVFARINPDDVDAVEKTVLRQIAEGKVDEAIETYRNSLLLQKAIEQLNVSIKETEDIQNLIPVLYRYANTCMLAGGDENIRKATEIQRKIAEENPESFEYAYQYANLLFQLLHKDLDIWVEKSLRLTGNETQLAQALFLKMGTLMIQNNPNEASTYANRLFDLLKEATDKFPFHLTYTYLTNITNLYTQIYSKSGEWAKAIEMVKENIKDVQEDTDLPPEYKRKNTQRLFGTLSNYYSKLNNYNLAREYTQKEFDLRRQDETDELALAEAEYDYYTTMASYYLLEEKFPQALAFCEKSSPSAEFLINKNSHKAYLYTQHCIIAGAVAQSSGNWELCEQEYLKANEILERRGEDLNKLAIIVARLPLSNLLIGLYSAQNNFEKANFWLKRACELAEIVEEIDPIVNAPILTEVFFAKAAVSYQQNNIKEAKLYYQKVLTLYEILEDTKILKKQVLISTLTNLGAINMMEKNNKEAMRLLKQSQKLLQKELKENPGSNTLLLSYANNINNQGSIILDAKNSADAIKYYSEAETIYKKLLPNNEPQLSYYLIDAQMNLSAAYFMEKNQEKAEELLDGCLERVTRMATSYPAVYEPIQAAVYLLKGVLYNKTNRENKGQKYVELALEQAKKYPNDPVILMILNEYKQDGIYKTK